MLKITAGIDGMACEMCEAHVNEAIRKHLNVKKVSSSHRKHQTVIIAEEEISDKDIKKALEGTGYKVTDISREPYEKKGLFSFRKHH
ncbi:MAG TPA: heavy-metal-associated domain-containing protein [Candidatus Scybalocola faecavium]|nr:heavy-metal-associated domain-containing protein [Candidatus Scybalocola faecavium]